MLGTPPPRRPSKRTHNAATVLVAVVVGFVALGALDRAISEAPDVSSLVITSRAAATRDHSFQMAGLEAAKAPSLPLFLSAEVHQAPAFVWPALGGITSYMDPDHPMGIDIGLDPSAESPILAAAAGTVEFAGGSDADAYGYYVRVNHGDGLVTLYAHLSEVLVTEGQAVAQGETLGLGGASGKATGKHLHFEVRVWDQLANPLDLLPVDPDQAVVSLDCGAGELALMRGGSASIDFTASLPRGTTIEEAAIAGSPGAMPFAQVEGGATVRVSTAPRVSMSGEESRELYTLNLVLKGAERDERSCDLRLATLESSFVPFSEASYAAASSGSPYGSEAPPAPPTAQPPANPIEPTPPPAAADSPPALVIPTNIPMLSAGTPSPTPPPTMTLVPSQTPTPTSTPDPSNTPPPTPTATPTSTATPSPTPSPTATPKGA